MHRLCSRLADVLLYTIFFPERDAGAHVCMYCLASVVCSSSAYTDRCVQVLHRAPVHYALLSVVLYSLSEYTSGWKCSRGAPVSVILACTRRGMPMHVYVAFREWWMQLHYCWQLGCGVKRTMQVVTLGVHPDGVCLCKWRCMTVCDW